jgi:NitT/TauT family transport system substrate-binding protein
MGGFYNVDPARLEEMAKKKVSYFRYADHGVNFLSRGIIVHTKYLGERDVNCRFLRATARAWAAAAQNPDEAARILLEMFPKGPRFELSRAEWVDTATLAHSAHTRGKTLGWMAREDWESLLDFQKTYGGATTTRPHAEYYSNDFIGC